MFIFAVTRIIDFMARPPAFLTLAQGVLLLWLLWFSWSPYVWLGNQVRADVGLIRAGTTVAMAAIFVAALVIPDAWLHRPGHLAAPLILAVTYLLVRGLHQTLYYFQVATGDPRQRRTLRRFAIPTGLAGAALILGAALPSETAQTLLWTAAFVIDGVGGRVASAATGWLLRSPSHFTERHALVVIIALGESLVSVGTGAGAAVTRGPVLVAALLGLTTAICLWWLYFENVAPTTGRALAGTAGIRRGQLAGDAYTMAHFALIAGIIFIALGIEECVTHVAHQGTRSAASTALGWAPTVALYGGVVAYLAGRATLIRLTLHSVPAAQFVAAAVPLALLPAARQLPALASLGLAGAFLVALCGYEWSGSGRHAPAPDPIGPV